MSSFPRQQRGGDPLAGAASFRDSRSLDQPAIVMWIPVTLAAETGTALKSAGKLAPTAGVVPVILPSEALEAPGPVNVTLNGFE